MWIREETIINATPKAVFDVSRDIGLHLEHGKAHGEIVVKGRTEGLMQQDEIITWEAKHLGMRRRLTVLMEKTIDPELIITTMTKGPFSHFVHFHRIQAQGNQTLLIDDVFIKAPFGILGYFAEILFLKKYMRDFIRNRNAHLKKSCGS